MADYSCRKVCLSKNVDLIQETCTWEKPLFGGSPQTAYQGSAATGHSYHHLWCLPFQSASGVEEDHLPQISLCFSVGTQVPSEPWMQSRCIGCLRGILKDEVETFPSFGEPWAWWNWPCLASKWHMCFLCCLVAPNSICGSGAWPLWSLEGRKPSLLSPGLLPLSICIFFQDKFPVISQESVLIPMDLLPPWVGYKWHPPCWKCSQTTF